MLTERKSWWGAEVADQSTPQIPPARGGPDERWLREGTGRPHGGSRKPLTPRRPARRLTRLTLISENGEKGYGLRMKSEIPTGWDGFKGTSLNRIKARHLKKKNQKECNFLTHYQRAGKLSELTLVSLSTEEYKSVIPYSQDSLPTLISCRDSQTH